MNCQSVIALLSAFYDRELPRDREAEVRAKACFARELAKTGDWRLVR